MKEFFYIDSDNSEYNISEYLEHGLKIKYIKFNFLNYETFENMSIYHRKYPYQYCYLTERPMVYFYFVTYFDRWDKLPEDNEKKYVYILLHIIHNRQKILDACILII